MTKVVRRRLDSAQELAVVGEARDGRGVQIAIAVGSGVVSGFRRRATRLSILEMNIQR